MDELLFFCCVSDQSAQGLFAALSGQYIYHFEGHSETCIIKTGIAQLTSTKILRTMND